jgi:polyhydroxyalkanoate synthase
MGSFFGVWMRSMQRMQGESSTIPSPSRKDKRFSDEDWQKNPFFDFLRQAYFVTADWAEKLVTEPKASTSTPATRPASTSSRSRALSPTNFVATNPQLYRETIASNGENLVRGMKMLAEDIRPARAI